MIELGHNIYEQAGTLDSSFLYGSRDVLKVIKRNLDATYFYGLTVKIRVRVLLV